MPASTGSPDPIPASLTPGEEVGLSVQTLRARNERYRDALKRIAQRKRCGDPGCACRNGDRELCDVGTALLALQAG